MPKILPHGEVRRAIRCPIDRARIDLLAVPPSTRICMRLRYVGSLPQASEDFVFGNRERHCPSRIEIDRADIGAECRRWFVSLANDDTVASLDLVAGDRFSVGGGIFDHYVSLGKRKVES